MEYAWYGTSQYANIPGNKVTVKNMSRTLALQEREQDDLQFVPHTLAGIEGLLLPQIFYVRGA
jgi:hypothetical protein